MYSLDSKKEIEKLDKGKVRRSIELLPEQVSQAWEEINKLDVPQSCLIAKNVVVVGMGGSGLGQRVVDSFAAGTIRVPIELFTEYNLPNYVNQNSLVILSSYSGNTEETISAAEDAIKRNASVFIIATGGKLAEIAKKGKLHAYIFNPKANPADQPRLALGYSITSILAVLAKCNYLTVSNKEVTEALVSMRKFTKEYGLKNPEKDNLAKLMAKRLKGKIPILVASEHLTGTVHAFKNQLNETSKNFAALFDIPELNHHLMEGLRNPAMAKAYLHFVFFESRLYASRVQKRYSITEDVVEKNGVEHDNYVLRSSSRLEQVFEILVFGSWVSFYLAMLYDIDPQVVPWVDYFKEKMA